MGLRLVFLGPPGAGKGTQAQSLRRTREIPQISTGDLLRREVAQGTALGREAKGFIDRGELVPDEVVVQMVRTRITEPDCASGFILDGFPRTRSQAEALDRHQSGSNGIDRVLFFDLPDSDIARRLSGRRSCPRCGATYHVTFVPPEKPGVCDVCSGPLVQRDDDKEATVLRRLREYREKTRDLIQYYEDRNLLVTLDAARPPAEVRAAIERAISLPSN